MMFRFFSILSVLCATVAQAESRLTPNEFDAFSQGKTLHFNQHGRWYGTEQYFEGRIVTWEDAAGNCQSGFWVAEPDDTICFYYEDDPEAHCWQVIQKSTGLAVRLLGGSEIDDLNLTAVDQTDVTCPAPFIGV